METLYIILATLIVYSTVSTIIYVISNENDDVLEIFGLGIVGLLVFSIIIITSKVIYKLRYRVGKRSVFVEEATHKNYKCKLKYTDDINGWIQGYRLVKRYASKSEYKNIPDFSKEFIEKALRNCDHCKYNDECQHVGMCKCKQDEYGVVLEFDKFEKK